MKINVMKLVKQEEMKNVRPVILLLNIDYIVEVAMMDFIYIKESYLQSA
jgi:hypothetical protein